MERTKTKSPYSSLGRLIKSINHFRPAAPIILRLIIGFIMILHGLAKLQAGPTGGLGDFFVNLSIPTPVVMAWVVTIIEFAGGIFLILGLLTRITAFLFSGVMIGAILMVSIDLGLRSTASGPGADLNLALLAGSLALVFWGPGKFAIDHLLQIEPKPVAPFKAVSEESPKIQ